MAAIDFLKDWQTLVAGVLAIGAAFIGGGYINKQVRQADLHEVERRRARLAAARATLPLTLSALAEYANSCGVVLQGFHALGVGGAVPGGSAVMVPPLPAIPSNLVGDLKDMIGAADDATARPFIAIIAKIQVQNVRLKEVYSRLAPGHPGGTVVTIHEIETYIIDAAEIYALASELFDYARREHDNVPTVLTWEAVRSALRLMAFYEVAFPAIHAAAQARAEASATI